MARLAGRLAERLGRQASRQASWQVIRKVRGQASCKGRLQDGREASLHA